MRKRREYNRIPYFVAITGVGLALLLLAVWYGQFSQLLALS
jgi:hypothetical protein